MITMSLLLVAYWTPTYSAYEFDDWPTKWTVPILNTLEERATFYMRGDNIIWNEDIVLQVYEGWHEICNHTYNHPDITKISKWELRLQIMITNHLIKNITGKSPKCFRPPYGRYNQDTIDVLNEFWMELRRSMANGIIDSMDWKYQDEISIVVEVLKSSWHTVLFHDTSERSYNSFRRLYLMRLFR